MKRAESLFLATSRHARDAEGAITLYRAACDRGAGSACNWLAEFYFSGEGSIEKSDTKAAELFAKACAANHASACVSVGNFTANGLGGIPKEPSKARTFYEKGLALLAKECDGKKVQSCASLAYSYENDFDALPADKTKALASFQKALAVAQAACDKGDAEACNSLGILYDNGKATAPDQRKANSLFERACNAGNAEACSNLGLAHENGRGGLPKDPAKALELYLKACDASDGRGCAFACATLYEPGPLLDKVRSTKLCERGCDLRNAGACNDLGVAYADGEGRTEDKQKALSIYERACALGSRMGCKNHDRLASKLEAEKVAMDFRKALAVGSESHCGLVVEVKPPIAKIQTMIGEVWLKIEQLFPKGKQDCRFHNGVYQTP